MSTKRFAIRGVIGFVALTAACGRPAATHPVVPSLAATVAYAGPQPPEEPCAFPDAAQLAQLAGGSDLVVAGTVEGQPQVVTYPGINHPFTRYALRVRSVLRGSTAESVLTIEESGGVVQPILNPGPQVVFLYKNGPTMYTVFDGLNATFLTRPNGMTRECPHGVERASDFVTDGSNEATFSNRIRGLTPTKPPTSSRRASPGSRCA